PSLREPQVKSIQYASPGEIRLELLSNVSVELRYILDSICKNKDALEEITKDIQSHLREQKLSKIPGNNPSIILTENTKTFLRSNFRLLSKNLGLSSYTKEIRNLATNDLVATKILLSIYRRAKKISAFKDKGMIEL
ncbi:MAG: hypothetical protein N0C86_14970, partial [Candidatus Thiodiazotropha taylori]|nr:hypothetical protein [Candidatus Thiodiazotropha taylori]MCW4327295.1 hypothetical protein [Candidatus Thiodiazotropha taylori]